MRVDDWQGKSADVALKWREGRQVTYGELTKRIKIRAQELAKVEQEVFIVPITRELESIVDLFALVALNKLFIPVEPAVEVEKIQKLATHFAEVRVLDQKGQVYQGGSPAVQFPDELLFIGFTSGTTGEAKGFLRDHQSWVRSFENFERIKDFQGEKVLCLSPLNYTLGLYTLFDSLYFGKTFLLDTTRLEDIVDEKVEISGVPSSLRLDFLKSAPQVSEEQSKGSFLFILSGEAFDQTLAEKIEECYPYSKLLTFYGSSETSFISYQYQTGQKKTGEVLFPEVKLNLNQADQEGIGEIQIQSPMNFSGYYQLGRWEKPARWISTGDLGSYNQGLVLFGRKDDCINRGGEKIFALVVEDVLRKHPVIQEVRISKKSDKILGEKVVGEILWKKESLSLEEVNDYLKEQSLRRMVIDQLLSVSEIKLNLSGKRQRKERKNGK